MPMLKYYAYLHRNGNIYVRPYKGVNDQAFHDAKTSSYIISTTPPYSATTEYLARQKAVTMLWDGAAHHSATLFKKQDNKIDELSVQVESIRETDVSLRKVTAALETLDKSVGNNSLAIIFLAISVTLIIIAILILFIGG